MERIYTLESFSALDIATKSFIIEDLLSDDYYGRQTDLFTLDIGVEYTPEVQEKHEILFESLIEELSLKIFSDKKELKYDFEKNKLASTIRNEAIYNMIRKKGFATIRPNDSSFDPENN
ncbi:hypothetical protein [Chryseobacterium sp. ON_d1]|uniref:hypothetical protein n=1 Tax=Chryseobacterium sp. ON_d1 TaxID=2583211 RepID=UPI00115AAD90|nr:hypothetical protein [Chryseobacterium sp. ON_d1]GEJ48148.1 hypothetical protein CRS_47570 [Chryseobacterium sp. ON_d1]